MSNDPIADMRFAQLLLRARQSDPAIPHNPIKVHLFLRMYQVYESLGPDMACGVDILIQDTDITPQECLICCDSFSEEGNVEILAEDAFRLTTKGAERAKFVHQFYQECFS